MIIHDEFVQLLRKMRRVYEDTGINLSMSIYREFGQDEVIKYEYFLNENVMKETKKTTYLLSWDGGNEESYNAFITGERISYNIHDLKDMVETKYMEEKYGEEEYDDDLEDYINGKIEEPYKCDLTKEELEDRAYHLLSIKHARNMSKVAGESEFILMDRDGNYLLEIDSDQIDEDLSLLDDLERLQKTYDALSGKLDWYEEGM